jgi:hypothetical protein
VIVTELERLYLTALTSNWWLDWQRYYAAEDRIRQARLHVMEQEAKA